MAESMPDSRSGDPGSKASIGRRVPAGAPEQSLAKITIVTGTPGVGKTVLGKLLGKTRVYEIDATGKRPRELLHETLRMMSRGKGWSLNSSSDWLEKYDPVLLSRRIL